MTEREILQLAHSTEGLLRLTRYAINDQIDRIISGRFDVVVPLPEKHFVRFDDKHFHLRPELFIQLAGISRMSVVDGEIAAYPGMTMVIPRGVAHDERSDLSLGSFCNIVFAYNNRSMVLHAAVCVKGVDEPGSYSIKARTTIPIRDGARLYGYLNEAATFTEEGRSVDHPLVTGQLLTHYGMLAELLEESSMDQEQPGSHMVTVAQRVIYEDLCNSDLSVKKIAESVKCSADYLSHAFSRQKGQTLSEYINEERVAVAKQLLLETSMNISEIAASCGYNDPSYFSRVFTRLTGHSPRCYREAHATYS